MSERCCGEYARQAHATLHELGATVGQSWDTLTDTQIAKLEAEATLVGYAPKKRWENFAKQFYCHLQRHAHAAANHA